jgi:hypothetical protein
MTARSVLAAALALAFVAGCAAAPARSASGARPAPDPDRWERAACRLQQYPPELDGRALARARLQDLEARRNGSTAPSVAASLVAARDAFDGRCAAWLAASARGATSAPGGPESWTSL